VYLHFNDEITVVLLLLGWICIYKKACICIYIYGFISNNLLGLSVTPVTKDYRIGVIEMEMKRNSAGLVDMLMNELDALNNGESTPQMAKAKASNVNAIVSVKRLELDAARFVPKTRSSGKDNMNIKALPLG